MSVQKARHDAIRGLHLDGDPVIGTDLLADELGWHFSSEETDKEDGLAIVVVVRVHVQILEQIVAEGLPDVASVELEGEEHQADPCADSFVNLQMTGFLSAWPVLGVKKQENIEGYKCSGCPHLSDHAPLLLGLPLELWVKAMYALICVYRLVVLRVQASSVEGNALPCASQKSRLGDISVTATGVGVIFGDVGDYANGRCNQGRFVRHVERDQMM